jgi:hypothetical protein
VAITRERFNQGMTLAQFKDSMTRNRDRLEANERAVEIRPDDLEAFKNLPQPVDVLVIGADWCYDVLTNLPVLAKLAEQSGRLNLRVFERDASPDIMAEYMNGPYQSIPVFAFFDEDFNEIGRWIERPKNITDLREQKRLEIFRAHPEFGSPDAPADELPEDLRGRLSQSIQEMRAATIPTANQEVIEDLREIVFGGKKAVGNLAAAVAAS